MATQQSRGRVGTAYQKIMRDKFANKGSGTLLDYSHPLPSLQNMSLKDTVIKQVNYRTARAVIEKYEWLGCMPATSIYYFGIFFKGVLGGVLVFGHEYSENLGVWDKYSYTGKLLLLSRGVCMYWTPKNTASYFISKVLRWIRNNTQYRIITATVDGDAGEIGTIYPSLGWHYVGSMREQNSKCNGKLRFAVKINGKIYGSRSMRSRVGSQRKEEILRKYPNAIITTQRNKERYFFFVGSVKERRKYLKSIEAQILSYPKRSL